MKAKFRQELNLPSVQRRNLRFVVFDGAAIGLMSAAASFVSVWVIRLGAPPFWVSLLSSAPSMIGPLMTIPWSQFADRQRRPQWVFAWARAAVHLVYPLVAILPFFLSGETAAKVIIVVWSLSGFPSSLSNMMFTLVMGRAMPPERRAFLMSRRWIVLGMAKLIALPLISQLIDRVPFPYGYQLAYGINGLIAIAAFYCAIQISVPEHEPAQPTRGERWLTRVREEVGGLVQAKAFLVFVAGRAMLNLGLALVSAIIPIYWVNHLSASDAWIGYFNATLSGATLLSYFPWVRIKRKWGTRWTLVKTFTNGISTGARGLAAIVDGDAVLVAATTTETSANKLVVLRDDGSVNPAWNTIATAAANTVFRGVSLAAR